MFVMDLLALGLCGLFGFVVDFCGGTILQFAACLDCVVYASVSLNLFVKSTCK